MEWGCGTVWEVPRGGIWGTRGAGLVASGRKRGSIPGQLSCLAPGASGVLAVVDSKDTLELDFSSSPRVNPLNVYLIEDTERNAFQTYIFIYVLK